MLDGPVSRSQLVPKRSMIFFRVEFWRYVLEMLRTEKQMLETYLKRFNCMLKMFRVTIASHLFISSNWPEIRSKRLSEKEELWLISQSMLSLKMEIILESLFKSSQEELKVKLSLMLIWSKVRSKLSEKYFLNFLLRWLLLAVLMNLLIKFFMRRLTKSSIRLLVRFISISLYKSLRLRWSKKRTLMKLILKNLNWRMLKLRTNNNIKILFFIIFLDIFPKNITFL